MLAHDAAAGEAVGTHGAGTEAFVHLDHLDGRAVRAADVPGRVVRAELDID